MLKEKRDRILMRLVFAAMIPILLLIGGANVALTMSHGNGFPLSALVTWACAVFIYIQYRKLVSQGY